MGTRAALYYKCTPPNIPKTRRMSSIPEAVSKAIQYFEAGRIQAAEQIFRQILQIQPNHLDALHWLGTVLEAQGNLDEASNAYRQALILKPDSFQAHFDLGTALLKQNKYQDAIACYQHALILNPEDPLAHSNLGSAFEGLGQLDEAILNYRRAAQLRPSDPVAYNSLGVALQKQGQLNDAAICFQQALALKPDYVIAHCNMGIAFQKQNRHDYAVTCYQNALVLNPDSSEAHYNLGMAWLQLGEFSAGWTDFEWRIKVKRLPEFRLPKWDGSPLTGRRILLYAEQGLGDTIQFIRYAQLVKNRGGHVIVACQPRLVGLFKNCSGIDVLVPQPKSSADGLPPFDFYLHLLSVPNVLGTTLDSIPHDVPYLQADERLVEQWGQELGSGNELKVGLAWQGNRLNPNDRGRSIRLAEFEPLARVQGVKFFSLQKGDGSEQVRPMAGRMEITDFSDRLDLATNAFVDTAAVMKNLDLVITSDMAVAHLAGALGVPVWVALSHSPDWRWLLSRDDSPWYPTMRLFRQEIPGDWASVFRRIAAELRHFGLPEGSDDRPLKTEILPSSGSGISLLVEASIGELVDKITILEIKSVRIIEAKKLANVRLELESLQTAYRKVLESIFKSTSKPDSLGDLVSQLKSVNEALWQIEDKIRDHERSKEFGPEFVELARSVYRQNDRRAALKRQINELLGSRIVEEKSYQEYDVPAGETVAGQ